MLRDTHPDSLTPTTKGYHPAEGGQAEGEDKGNADHCLGAARPRGTSGKQEPGKLLPLPAPAGGRDTSALPGAGAGQPGGTEGRRQLRPRSTRRHFYEDDPIPKDDDYLCE